MDETIGTTRVKNKAPTMRFNHMGLVVKDIERMEDFYVRILGFTVTDKGDAQSSGNGTKMVFLTLDPHEHHQIFLVEGRPENIPSNTKMPNAGPVIAHLAFRLESLAGLQSMHSQLRGETEGETRGACHGNTWSIYASDPEGNTLEFFVDTPWYCHQPFYVPIDFELTENELFQTTKKMVENAPGFKTHEEFRTELAERVA